MQAGNTSSDSGNNQAAGSHIGFYRRTARTNDFVAFCGIFPEYQAMRWAQKHGAYAAFIDLPSSRRLSAGSAPG